MASEWLLLGVVCVARACVCVCRVCACVFSLLLCSLSHLPTLLCTFFCRLVGGLDIMRDMGDELADVLKE